MTKEFDRRDMITAKPAHAAVRDMSIVQALDWAFRAECAQIEFDELHVDCRPGTSTIWLMMQRGQLGCQIDGGGRSVPPADAEIIASAVSALPIGQGGRGMAVQVAGLARAGMQPDWMRNATPRCVPRDWRMTKHGMFARTEVVSEVISVHRGRRITRSVVACPVTYTPTGAQIAAARRNYLDWWGALLHLRHDLASHGMLSRIRLTTAMPAMTPWREQIQNVEDVA